MDELRIVRGTDVILYADDQPLFGVTEFSAVQTADHHKVREYLSAEPYAYIPQGKTYQLRIQVLTLFDEQLPDAPFTLCVKDGGREYRYRNCRVTGRKTEAQGSKNAVTVISAEADDLIKRGMEDEG